MAISGWRRCLHLCDILQSVVLEKRFPKCKTDGEKLLACMKADGVTEEGLNDQTVKRYLSLGKRCEHHTSQLMKWEAFHHRDALIDNITTLRLVFQISDQEDHMRVVLKDLFMQQRAGIRTSLMTPKSKNEVRAPANISRACIIRQQILINLARALPQLKTTIDHFAGPDFFFQRFNIQSSGKRDKDCPVVAVSDSEDDETQADHPNCPPAPSGEGSGLTSVRSRALLEDFLKKLITCKHDTVLCKMARLGSYSHTFLDLSSPDASPLKKMIDEISTAYVTDFPGS